MLCDLNIPWPVTNYDTKPTQQQINTLKSILKVLISFKYTHVAINFTVQTNVKFPSDSKLINPIDLGLYFPEFLNVEDFKIFSRITMTIDDPSQSQGLSKISQYFDIIAVKPISEKALITSITNLEINLISLELGERLPCYLKHKTVGSAVEKGIFFEITYNPLINSNTGDRKTFLSNVKSLIRASRSRGMTTSSGARNPIDIRNSVDLIQLLNILGLNSGVSQKTFVEWPLKILLSSRLRIKSYKQVIGVIGQGEENIIDNKSELVGEVGESKVDARLYVKKRTNKNDSLIQRQLKKKQKLMK